MLTLTPSRAIIPLADRCPRCDTSDRRAWLMQEVVTHPALTAVIVFCASSKCGYSDVLTATTTGDRRVATALLRYKRALRTIALLAFLLLFVSWWAVSATISLFR